MWHQGFMGDTRQHSDYCQSLVRKEDHDRYLVTLFCEKSKLRGLFALLAFHVEVAKTRESISDPMLGEIRLQWWKEAIDGIVSGKLREHPVIAELAIAVKCYDLPIESLYRLVEIRKSEIYDQAPQTLSGLVEYAKRSSGALHGLCCHILNKDAAPARRAAVENVGTAWGLMGIIRAITFHAAMQRSFIPTEMLTQHNIDPEGLFKGDFGEGVIEVVKAIAEQAKSLLVEEVKDAPKRGDPSFPLFLYKPMIGLYQKQLEDCCYDVTKLSQDTQEFKKIRMLVWAMMWGRV